MLSEDAKRQMAETKGRNRGAEYLAGRAELLDSRFGARTIGLMAEITPGMELWATDARRDHLGEALGGYVLAVDPGRPPTYDDETGEITKHPALFRCYNPHGTWPHRAFPVIPEDQVDRPSVAVPPDHHLVIAIRRFCREVAHHDSLTLDAFDAGLVTDAARLAAVLMGGR